MSEAIRGKRQVPSSQSAASNHYRNLEQSAVAVERAIKLLAPDGKPDTIVQAFDNRTTYGVIRSWRDGRRYVAQWAIDLIDARSTELANIRDAIPRGPGMRAGDKNLIRRWR